MSFAGFLNNNNLGVILDQIKVEMQAGPTPWTFVYDGTASSISANRVLIMKTKSAVNSAGAGTEEYFYICLEITLTGPDILLRLCKTATGAGVVTGFTPTIDAQGLGKITPVGAPYHAYIVFSANRFALFIESFSGSEGVFACSMLTMIPTGQSARNFAHCMGKTDNSNKVWALDAPTFYTADDYDIFVPVEADQLSVQGTVPFLHYWVQHAAVYKTAQNTMIGFLNGVHFITDPAVNLLDNFTMPNLDNYRGFKNLGSPTTVVIKET